MKLQLASKARIGLAAASVLSLGLLAGCGSGDSGDTSKSTLQKIKDSGTVTVAIAGEAPYSFLDDGELKGGSVAIAKTVFKEMGVENVKAKKTTWSSLIPSLTAGRVDMVSAGMSILPKRCKQADFSLPTIMYTTALMVQKGNPMGLTDMKSVVAKKDDVKLAVLAGGIEAGYAKELGLTDVQSVPDAQTGMDTVANGRADAFAMTAISLNYMAKNNPDAPVDVTPAFTAVIDGVKQIGSGASVFRPGDDELRKAYNKVLKEKVLKDPETYLSVVGEYGFTKDNLPPNDLTTKQLCAGNLG